MSLSISAKRQLLASPKIRVVLEYGHDFRGRCVGDVAVGIYCEMMPASRRLVWISDPDEADLEWSFDVSCDGGRWLNRSGDTHRIIPSGSPYPIYHGVRPAAVVYFDGGGGSYLLATAGVIATACEPGRDRKGEAVAWCVPDGYLRSLITGHDPGFCPDDAHWREYTGISSIYALD